MASQARNAMPKATLQGRNTTDQNYFLRSAAHLANFAFRLTKSSFPHGKGEKGKNMCVCLSPSIIHAEAFMIRYKFPLCLIHIGSRLDLWIHYGVWKFWFGFWYITLYILVISVCYHWISSLSWLFESISYGNLWVLSFLWFMDLLDSDANHPFVFPVAKQSGLNS